MYEQNSHVVLCGQISQYEAKTYPTPPIPDDITQSLNKNNSTREGCTVRNCPEKIQESFIQLESWFNDEKLKNLEKLGRGFKMLAKRSYQ